jgi:hypothetical protein
MEYVHLTQKGAVWWHTDDYAAPNLSKASLGTFFFEVLREGGQIGDVWAFNYAYPRSLVLVSVYMTEEMKNAIERRTRFKFRLPPKISLNGDRSESD